MDLVQADLGAGLAEGFVAAVAADCQLPGGGAIPGGQVKRELRDDGLVCTVEVPLPEPGPDAAKGGA